MLMPKRVKRRRVHRGRMKGKATRGTKITYGEYGIQALEPGWITSAQIEAARVAMTRYIKEMAGVAERLADRDISAEVQPLGKDDQFGNAFKRMLDGLNESLSGVAEAVEQVKSASSQIADGSQSLAHGAQQQEIGRASCRERV